VFTPGRIFFRKAGAHHTIAGKACMLRLAPWLCVVLLAVLSLVPGDAQIRTGAPGIAEHVMAYCGTAVLFTVGYPARGPVQIILGLAGYAGCWKSHKRSCRAATRHCTTSAAASSA
jgi:hypothetical protein